MAIKFYSGNPGSGKSYDVVVSVALPALKSGRRIVTNLPLNKERLEREGLLDLVTFCDQSDCVSSEFWAGIPGGSILILDEVWRLWPSGTRQSSILPAVQQFFAEHRHRVGEDGLTCEVVLISQQAAQVAKVILALVEEVYDHHKLNAVGQANRFRVDVRSGVSPKSIQLNQFYGTYSAEVWEYYQSHTGATAGVVGKEVNADGRGNIFKGYLFRFGLPVAVVVGVLGLVGVYRVFSGESLVKGSTLAKEPPATERGMEPKPVRQPDKTAEETRARALAAEAKAKAEAEAAAAEAAKRAAEAAAERVRGNWRITGEVRAAGAHYLLLGARDGGRRRVPADQCTDTGGGWSCPVDGALVTAYTGGSALWAGSNLASATAGR